MKVKVYGHYILSETLLVSIIWISRYICSSLLVGRIVEGWFQLFCLVKKIPFTHLGYTEATEKYIIWERIMSLRKKSHFYILCTSDRILLKIRGSMAYTVCHDSLELYARWYQKSVSITTIEFPTVQQLCLVPWLNGVSMTSKTSIWTLNCYYFRTIMSMILGHTLCSADFSLRLQIEIISTETSEFLKQILVIILK